MTPKHTTLTLVALLPLCLSGCALATGLTVVAAAPALEPLLPAPKPLAEGYRFAAAEADVVVEPTLRRFCPGLRNPADNAISTRCARLRIGPPEAARTDIQTRLRIAKQIVAANPHMTWPEIGDAALVGRNFDGEVAEGVGVMLNFPYTTTQPVETVFAEDRTE